MILVCVFCGIFSMLMYQKWSGRKFEKISLLKAVVLNFIISLCVYGYYIGYSFVSVKAALFRISPNALYFAIMSVLVSVIMMLVLIYRDKLAREGCMMIDFQLTELDKKIGSITVVVAFIVRIIGINWGAGVTFHPDEGNVIRTPITMADNNTLMADYLFYPSQITSKILCIMYEIIGFIGHIFNFEVTNLMHVYIARFYITLLSVGTVVCIFLIGNHLKKHAGTVAALLATVFPPFVYAAHCVIGDNFVTLCVGLIILCALHYLEKEQEYVWLVLMSVVAAMATLDKYHGMVLCALIAIVVCVKQVKKRAYQNIILQGCIAIGVVLLTVIIISPNLFMDYKKSIDAVLFFIQNDAYDKGATFTSNLSAYITWFISNVGILSLIPIGIGLYNICKEKNIVVITLFIAIVELIAMCFQTRHCIRWGLPVYVCLIIIVGMGIADILDNNLFKSRLYIKSIVMIGLVLIYLNGVAGTFLLDVIYKNSEQDTRIVSEEWCLQEGIREEECIYDNYTCWRPGGMIQRGDYPWRYDVSVRQSVIEQDGQLWIKNLGRKYAVENLGNNKSGILDDYHVERLAYYETDYHEDGAFWEAGQKLSVKVFELYSIIDALQTSYQILSEQIFIGDNMVIYDISNIPAYEQYEITDFEIVHGEMSEVYQRELESISRGRYNVELKGIEKPIIVLLEDEKGNVIQMIDIQQGQAEFELKEDYHNLIMKLHFSGESNTFEYLKIATCY